MSLALVVLKSTANPSNVSPGWTRWGSQPGGGGQLVGGGGGLEVQVGGSGVGESGGGVYGCQVRVALGTEVSAGRTAPLSAKDNAKPPRIKKMEPRASAIPQKARRRFRILLLFYFQGNRDASIEG